MALHGGFLQVLNMCFSQAFADEQRRWATRASIAGKSGAQGDSRDNE